MTNEELLKQIQQVEDKISSLDNLQMAIKILINSLYGAIGNEHFRYYDKRMAEGITLSGQLAVLWIARKFNEFFNKAFKTNGIDYVIYIDTDSNYLDLSKLVESYPEIKSVEDKINLMDDFCKEVLSPFTEKSFKELANYMNAYEQKMVMGRDTISSKGIFCSKKKYILNEYDSEGVRYTEPKKKIIGLQMIQSSTPKIIKEKLHKSLNLILDSTEEELQEYVLKLESEFKKYNVEDIAKPSGIDGISKYQDAKTLYIKGTPIHVRGTILYNSLVKKYNLENELPLIRDGDKIKLTYLKLPNPIRENVITFPNELPKQFGLHQFVDHETQFEKIYMSALETILDVIGWTAYKSNDMGDLFG